MLNYFNQVEPDDLDDDLAAFADELLSDNSDVVSEDVNTDDKSDNENLNIETETDLTENPELQIESNSLDDVKKNLTNIDKKKNKKTRPRMKNKTKVLIWLTSVLTLGVIGLAVGLSFFFTKPVEQSPTIQEVVNGKIELQREISVDGKPRADILVTPDEGYKIKEVVIDSKIQDLKNITEGKPAIFPVGILYDKHNISAKFEIRTFNIEFLSNSNNISIYCNDELLNNNLKIVDYGTKNTSISIEAKQDYKLETIKVNGVIKELDDDNAFKFLLPEIKQDFKFEVNIKSMLTTGLIFKGVNSLGEFTNNNEEIISYSIVGCEAIDSEIYIPKTFLNKPVTKINTNSFNGNNLITKIYIPSSITVIEENAFINCNNLKNVIIDSKTIVEHNLINSGLTDFATSISIEKNIINIPEYILNNYDIINSGMHNYVTYFNGFTVKYIDYNDQLIKEEIVKKGLPALAPQNPIRDGYQFIGWDNDYSNIQKNIIVKAKYEKLVDIAVNTLENVNIYVNNELINLNGKTNIPFNSTIKIESIKGYHLTSIIIDNENIEIVDNNLVEYISTKEQNHIINAVATANTYQVVFNGNTATNGEMKNQDFLYNIEQHLTTNLYEKTGYLFKGWAREQNGIVDYNDMQIVKNLTAENNAEITLYAQWEINTYTLTFNSLGGTSTEISRNILYNNEYGELPRANKIGYQFIGWLTQLENGEQVTGKELMPANDVVIYAHYIANTYQVLFNGNTETSGEMQPQLFSYNKAQNLLNNTYEKTGYSFVGWNTNQNGIGGKLYQNEEMVKNLATENDAKITLYAQWQINTYTLIFNAVGGIATQASKNIIYNNEYGELPQANKKGYQFNGWFTAKENGNQILGKELMPANNVEIFAQYSANTYQVVFDGNTATSGEMQNQTFTYDQPQKLITNNFVKDKYLFGGWNINQNGVGGKLYQNEEIVKNLTAENNAVITLYAQWRVKDYIAYFHRDKLVTKVQYAFGKGLNLEQFPIIEEKTGHTIDGWYNQEVDGEKVTEISADDFGDKHFYAHWTVNKYVLTFNANGGIITPNTREVTFNTAYNTISKLPIPTFEGYSFAGWYTDKENGTQVLGNELMPANDVEIFAHWGINSYTLIFNALDGMSTEASRNVVYNDEFGELPPVSKTGYQFNGWFTDKIGGKKVEKTNLMPANDVEIFAQYTANTYKIVFDGNTATSGEMPKQTLTYDKIQNLFNNQFEKIGYLFKGWSKEKNGLVDFVNSSSVKNLTIENGVEIILYAQWEIINYTITVEDYDAIYSSIIPPTYTVLTETITLPTNVTKDGFTFVNWTKDNQEILALEKGSVGNITIVANFKINKPTNVKITTTYMAPVTYGEDVTLIVEHDIIEGLTYSYEWTKDGEIISKTTQSIIIKNVVESGEYQAKVIVEGLNQSDFELSSNTQQIVINKATATIEHLPDILEYKFIDQEIKITGAKLNHNETEIIYMPATVKAIGPHEITISASETENYYALDPQIIIVTVVENRLQISVIQAENGTIKHNDQIITGIVVNYNSRVEILITPNVGYELDTILLDGIVQQNPIANPNNSYTFIIEKVIKSQTLEVTFYQKGTEGLTYQGLNLNGENTDVDSEIVSYTVMEYSGSEPNVIIPKKYNGKPVTQISDSAFNNCITLTSITISNCIITIGNRAFENCTSLTEVIIESADVAKIASDNNNNLLQNATSVYVKNDIKEINPYLQNNFTKQSNSDKAGYDLYVKNNY